MSEEQKMSNMVREIILLRKIGFTCLDMVFYHVKPKEQ